VKPSKVEVDVALERAITIYVTAVEFSRHRDEAGLDQVDSLLIPVVHLRETPPAYDLPAPGHATRVTARRADT